MLANRKPLSYFSTAFTFLRDFAKRAARSDGDRLMRSVVSKEAGICLSDCGCH
jgi:hypothetical protein